MDSLKSGKSAEMMRFREIAKWYEDAGPEERARLAFDYFKELLDICASQSDGGS